MTPTPARRLVLVPAPPARSRSAGPSVRRYRIARVRLEDRDVTRAEALRAPEAKPRLS